MSQLGDNGRKKQLTEAVRTACRRLAYAFGVSLSTTDDAAPAADSRGYNVRLPAATARPAPHFRINYKVIGGVHLWQQPRQGLVGTTALTAHSGAGKTTLLNHLFRRLCHVHTRTFPFEFSPDLHATSSIAVAFVPQNPPFVYHWQLRHVLPHNSLFYKALMPSKPFDADRRLRQFAGGEIRRIYAASCLAFLRASAASTAFLLLDETFDGLGPIDMKRSVTAIRACWLNNAPNRALHILLVTHHDHQSLVSDLPDSLGLAITIDPTESTDEGVSVSIRASSTGASP